MSTLRINNIEAKSVPASPTLDEKVKITNSTGDVLVHVDGKTSGITTIGINTTASNITFDANSNVKLTGIITASSFSGDGSNLTGIDASALKIGGVVKAQATASGVNITGNLGVGNTTTVGRNAGVSTATGALIFNTTSQTLEFYTGSIWVGTNAAPSLNSITGDIYNGMTGSLVINCSDISASGNDVKYSNNSTGAVIATDTSATTSGANITSTIPSAVYNTAVGTVIKIEVINGSGVLSSNSLTETILASPSGGTITSAGGYRYHTFAQGTTNFVNTISNLSVQYLVVAGGGGGGGNQGGGGGGAGGYRTGSATLATGNFQAVVGAGGNNGGNGAGAGAGGSDGGNSSFNGLTSTGGGGGVNMRTGGNQGQNGRSGGSGGGASHWMTGNFTGGAGTSGQGNGGGDALDTEGLGHNGGGGGGGGSNPGDGGNGVVIVRYAG